MTEILNVFDFSLVNKMVELFPSIALLNIISEKKQNNLSKINLERENSHASPFGRSLRLGKRKIQTYQHEFSSQI